METRSQEGGGLGGDGKNGEVKCVLSSLCEEELQNNFTGRGRALTMTKDEERAQGPTEWPEGQIKMGTGAAERN